MSSFTITSASDLNYFYKYQYLKLKICFLQTFLLKMKLNGQRNQKKTTKITIVICFVKIRVYNYLENHAWKLLQIFFAWKDNYMIYLGSIFFM